MGSLWNFTLPGKKAQPWEGDVVIEGGALMLTKPSEDHPTQAFAPGAWVSLDLVAYEPPPVTTDPAQTTTSPEVASIAAKGLANPDSLTPEEIKSVCASALSQKVADD